MKDIDKALANKLDVPLKVAKTINFRLKYGNSKCTVKQEKPEILLEDFVKNYKALMKEI